MGSSDQEDLFETHQTYIDLQLMLEGEEYMEWEDSSNLELEIPYEEEHDICFWKGSGKNIKITNQMFYLVFPHDAHKPCRYQEEPNKYRKLVFKLLRD